MRHSECMGAVSQGYAFQQLSQERGFKTAVADRDGKYEEQAKRAAKRLEEAERAFRARSSKL